MSERILPEWYGAASALFFLCILLAGHAPRAAEVREVTSPSGITAWMIEEKNVPLVAVKILFRRAGAAYDPKGREGLSYLTASLLNEGAGAMDAEAFQRALEERAIRLAAWPDEDFTVVSMETLSEHTEEAFRLLGLALRAPRFDSAAVERIRSAAQSELRQLESSPGYLVRRTFQEAAFDGHPYVRPSRGTPVGVNAVTRSDIAAFTAAHFSRDAMVIAVVGDIDAETLATLLDAHLAALPAESQAAEIARVRLPEPGIAVHLAKDLPQSVAMFGLNGVARKDPDYFTAFVLNHILGGDSLTSRLGKTLRGERGLAYYADSSLETTPHTAMLTGTFATRSERMEEAIAQMKQVIETLGRDGVTQEELAGARNFLTGSFPLRLDSNTALADYLAVMQIYGLGKDYLEKRNGYVRAVTLEDVNRVARRLLDPGNLVISVVGSAPSSPEEK